jgi:beta-lactamase regulating signal transducer with metallopeptidase domain
MEYILKSAITLSLLYSLFFFFLRKETFHRFNRLCLLFILAASLLLPLVHITLEHPTVVNKAVTASTTYITTLPAIVITAESEASLFTWSNVLACIYWTGLCVMLLYLIIQIIQTYQLIKGGLRHTDEYGNTVILKDEVKSPFSIFHYIVMSVEDYENHRRNILTHEQEHIRMGHSYDLLLLQVVKVLQWFNPYVWLLEADLKALHEYQADEAVINQGIDAKQYQQLLVVKAVGNRLQPFANNLRRGSLKKRIIMMYQKKSNRWLMLKAVAILPVTCFAIYAFATPESKVVEKLKNQVAAVEQSIKNVEAPVVELTMEEPAATIEQATETDKETAIAETPDTTATETSETVATEVPETTTAPKDSIYNVPEKLATFLEGEAAMYKHISQTMKYPKIAQECGVQGRVTVQFVVETDGTVSDITIINNRAGGSEVRDIEGEDPSITVICYTKKEGETQYLTRAEYNTARKALEDEVIRIVESTSGKWQPAEDKGQKVRCLFRLPISFRLH